MAAEKADGREIYATRPKWPEELAGKDEFKDLPVTVTSIVVAGVEMRTKHQHAWRFDLMDPKYGAPAQTIAYTAASKRVTLSLTREAFEYFRVPFKASSTDIKRAEQIIGASTVDPTELAWAWNIVAAGERAAEDDPAMPTEDRQRIRRLLRR